eukprot:1756222-Rhodomonas_salina.1
MNLQNLQTGERGASRFSPCVKGKRRSRQGLTAIPPTHQYYNIGHSRGKLSKDSAFPSEMYTPVRLGFPFPSWAWIPCLRKREPTATENGACIVGN